MTIDTTTPAAVVDRFMLDGINAGVVIAALKARRSFGGIVATIGAGYRDGVNSAPAWTTQAWQELTAVAQPVVITVLGAPGSHVGDCEPGNMTPAQVATWAAVEAAAGRYPVCYCDRSEKPLVEAACASRGLQLHPAAPRVAKSYGLWIATLDGTFNDLNGADLRKIPGVVAVQHLPAVSSGRTPNTGIEADGSMVVDPGWLPVKTAPPPTWQATALTLALEIEQDVAELVALVKAHQ